MFIDASLSFLPPGSAAVSCVGATGATFQIGNIIDLLGVGVGMAPPSIIGSQASLFGADPGNGLYKPQIQVNVGTAFATSDSATLDMQMEYAPDTATTFQPGTWYTIATTGPLAASLLAANTPFAKLDWEPAFPATLRPRYVRLLGVTPSGTQFTAGTIASAIVTMGRDDQSNKQAARNFQAA